MSFADALLHERQRDDGIVRNQVDDLIKKLNSCGTTDSFTDVPTIWIDEAIKYLKTYRDGGRLV